jgi:hypothetical protein
MRARQGALRDRLENLHVRMFGNIQTRMRVWLSEALRRSPNSMETHMIKFAFLGVTAILSTAIATPVLAQAVIQEPGAYAFGDPDGDLGIAPRASQRGSETTTRPWSAPVGHRQPRAADVPASASVSQHSLDQEDADIDRKIRSVCRGC